MIALHVFWEIAWVLEIVEKEGEEFILFFLLMH